MSNTININKDLLATFIFNYIFNNTLEEADKNKHISISNGFVYYKNVSNDLNTIQIIYEVTYHNTTETNEQLENYNYFTDKVDVVLGCKEEYTREECKELAETMYLKDENIIATILKLINPNTTLK
jgi:hypothetical protein